MYAKWLSLGTTWFKYDKNLADISIQFECSVQKMWLAVIFKYPTNLRLSGTGAACFNEIKKQMLFGASLISMVGSQPHTVPSIYAMWIIGDYGWLMPTMFHFHSVSSLGKLMWPPPKKKE